jgi:hypothetical protein
MEEVMNLWDRMSLTAKEDLRVDLSDAKGVPGGVMAAKFLTKRVINIDSIMRTLKPLWRAKGGVKGRDMGSNKLLFFFDNIMEMERVLANGPWSFDKFLILLQRVEDDVSFSSMTFDSCPFWVQIHDLPPRFMQATVCEKIGQTLGLVETVEDVDECRGRGNFMCARIMIDVTQPLCRGRKVWLGGAKDIWVAFKFERLPTFCYWCGRVTHGDRDCDLWLQSRGTLSVDNQQYGPWLRGDNERSFRGSTSRSNGDVPRPTAPKVSRGTVGGAVSPVRSTTSPQQESPKTSPQIKKTARQLTFDEQLKEIDRELCRESEDLRQFRRESTRRDHSNITQAGVWDCMTEGQGPSLDNGPTRIPTDGLIIFTAQTGSPIKVNIRSWKRQARMTSGSVSPPHKSFTHPPKRVLQNPVQFVPDRDHKKTKKEAQDDKPSATMKISVEVAEQPRRTP